MTQNYAELFAFALNFATATALCILLLLDGLSNLSQEKIYKISKLRMPVQLLSIAVLFYGAVYMITVVDTGVDYWVLQAVIYNWTMWVLTQTRKLLRT